MSKICVGERRQSGVCWKCNRPWAQWLAVEAVPHSDQERTVRLDSFLHIQAALFLESVVLQHLIPVNPAGASAAESYSQTANPPCPLPSAVSHVEHSRPPAPHGYACLLGGP